MINQTVKKGILKSTLLHSTYAQGQLEHLYELLLNDESVNRYKPFNFIRNLDSVSESTGIFKQWVQVNGHPEDEQDYYLAGKRISRALMRLSKEYEEILPEGMRGGNSLAIMFRVFFVPSSFSLTATNEVRKTLSFVSYILKTMLVLDLVFSNEKNINGYPAEYWVDKLLTQAHYDVDSLAIQMTSNCITKEGT